MHRVVGAVRVRRREDEDVEVVDQLPRSRVDCVVASSCSAVSRHVNGVAHSRACCWQKEDADLGAVAHLPDPHDEVLERPAGNVGVRRHRQEVRQVDLFPRLDDAGAGVAAIGQRYHQRARHGIAVDRRDDLRRCAGQRSGRIRRQVHQDVLAAHSHRQRRARDAGVAELGGDVVAALVSPRP